MTGGASVDTESDFMLANMLQHQYDQEHDTMISAYERKYNGDSKGISQELTAYLLFKSII